jgi:hypothetical protein
VLVGFLELIVAQPEILRELAWIDGTKLMEQLSREVPAILAEQDPRNGAAIASARGVAARASVAPPFTAINAATPTVAIATEPPCASDLSLDAYVLRSLQDLGAPANRPDAANTAGRFRDGAK